MRKIGYRLLTCLLWIFFITAIWKSISPIVLTNESERDREVLRILQDMESWQKQICDQQQEKFFLEDDIQSLPVMHRDFVPDVHSKNIFLIETSCNSRPLYRSWCSVESWANQHPDSDIWYILVSPFISDSTGVRKDILQKYPNVRVVSTNLRDTFLGTPLWGLFNSDKWLNTSWLEHNLSNMARGALVWKWGGTYSDTDSICIRNTGDLARNAVGLYSDKAANGAILIGEPNHKVYWMLMEYIKNNFKGYVWGHNGPDAITKVLNRICGVPDLRKLPRDVKKCHNVSILAPKYFYPIPYTKHDMYTADGEGIQFEKMFKDSYVLHFWNKLTRDNAIRVGSNSILEVASKKFCPVTFRTATLHSQFF